MDEFFISQYQAVKMVDLWEDILIKFIERNFYSCLYWSTVLHLSVLANCCVSVFSFFFFLLLSYIALSPAWDGQWWSARSLDHDVAEGWPAEMSVGVAFSWQ